MSIVLRAPDIITSPEFKNFAWGQNLDLAKQCLVYKIVSKILSKVFVKVYLFFRTVYSRNYGPVWILFSAKIHFVLMYIVNKMLYFQKLGCLSELVFTAKINDKGLLKVVVLTLKF